jgi:hypothetical protein
MTFVCVDPDDLATFELFEATLRRHRGQLLPVFLECSATEIARVARRKMASEQSARDFMAKHRICAVPRPTCLVLDSEAIAADANAGQIIRHFNLPTQ